MHRPHRPVAPSRSGTARVRGLLLWLVCSGLVVHGASADEIERRSTGPVTVSLADLDRALRATRDGDDDALHRLTVDSVRRRLTDASLSLDGGELLLERRFSDIETDGGCTRNEVRQLDARLTLAADTSLRFELTSLDAPIRLHVDLAARLDATGRARQQVGIRLDRCRVLATDRFDVVASGPFRLRMTLELNLAPRFVAPDRIRFEPGLSLGGELLDSDIDVDVDDTLFAGLIERSLRDELEDLFAPDNVAAELEALRESLASSLDAELDEGAVELTLPRPDDDQVRALYDLFAPDRPLALTIGHLDDRRIELLAAVLLDDRDALGELLGDAFTCEALGLLQVPLTPAATWSLDGGGCAPIDDASTAPVTGRRFSDPGCAQGFDFRPTTLRDACALSLDTLRFGNAADLPSFEPASEATPPWTLSPFTRLELGAAPLRGRRQPYSTAERYRVIDTDAGRCELEMRIHSPRPGTGASDLRPMIALHGGSWSARSTGALGLEASVLPFTERGFVVFAPFYRLLDDREGPPACNGATLEQILDDAHAALDWVSAHAARFGATGRPVLFGQSAGGHLASVLAVERAADVAGAAALYAPVDFVDFVREARAGRGSEDGIRILERVLDTPLTEIPLDAQLLLRNELPARVRQRRTDGGPVAPMFLLYGERDDLLPFRQGARLCDALAGTVDPSAPSMPALLELRRIVACGPDSELHLIAEGEHALDLCIADGICASGSPDSAAVVADSLRRLVDWAVQAGAPRDDEPGDADRIAATTADQPAADAAETTRAVVSEDVRAGGGGGGLGVMTLFLLGLRRFGPHLSSHPHRKRDP